MAFNEKIEEKRKEIADGVIASFKSNKQWAKGWYSVNANPHNAKTGRVYQGINWVVLLLRDWGVVLIAVRKAVTLKPLRLSLQVEL